MPGSLPSRAVESRGYPCREPSELRRARISARDRADLSGAASRHHKSAAYSKSAKVCAVQAADRRSRLSQGWSGHDRVSGGFGLYADVAGRASLPFQLRVPGSRVLPRSARD